jgi:hypothetical protein
MACHTGKSLEKVKIHFPRGTFRKEPATSRTHFRQSADFRVNGEACFLYNRLHTKKPLP